MRPTLAEDLHLLDTLLSTIDESTIKANLEPSQAGQQSHKSEEDPFDNLTQMLQEAGDGIVDPLEGSEDVGSDGSEASGIIEHYDGGQLNRRRVTATHRRVSAVQTADGMLEVVEEEAVDPAHLDEGPESLSDATTSVSVEATTSSASEITGTGQRKRSVVTVTRPPRASGNTYIPPPRPRSVAPNPSNDLALQHARTRRTAASGMKRSTSSGEFSPLGIGFVKPSLRPIREAPSPAPPSPIVKEGFLRLGRDQRWFVLSHHKLEFWRTADTTVQSLGVISLGLKELSPNSSISFKISNTIKHESVVLHCRDPVEFIDWLKKIVAVIADYRRLVLETKMIKVLPNGWIGFPLKVFVGSWNVGNAPPSENLQDWVPPPGDCDIIALGAQECRYTPPVSRGHTSATEDWFSRLTEVVGDDYVVVFRESLWEIRNIVFIRKSLAGFVHSVEGATVATGIANTLGNKGGVGIRFHLFDTSFCFINSHLAAHIEDCESRNQDYRQIVTHMRLGRPDVDCTNLHDYCFWFGDLNYRLDDTRENVLDLISKGQVTTLHGFDQLIREKREGRSFCGFEETPPPFRPTYRYDRDVLDDKGERIYGEEKQRVPSWCDRILWKNYPSNFFQQIDYHCEDKVQSSDHSPVFSTFNLVARMPPNVLYSLSGRPFAPKTGRDDKVSSTIQFSDVSAQSLCGYEPNIYIKFLGSFLPDERKWKTSILPKTSQPRWEQTDAFPLVYSDLEYLRTQHVILVFMDDTVGNNRPLGQAVVPLAEACGDKPYRFDVDIYHYGLVHGRVSGSVLVSNLRSAAEKLRVFQK